MKANGHHFTRAEGLISNARLGIYHDIYHGSMKMKSAKLFNNGRSQAIRLPQAFRFTGSEVYISSYDGLVILIPKKSPWASLVASLDRFSDDFMSTREQPPLQPREPA